MKARKTLMAAIASLTVASSATQAGGIPVFDGANVTQAVAQVKALGEQLTALQEQLDTLKGQAQTVTNMYNEARGITQHATMLANSVEDMHGFFPSVEYEISDLLTGPLNTVAKGLRSAKEMFSFDMLSEKEGTHLPSVELYKERGDVTYAYMSAAKQSYEEFAKRRAMLETFVTAASTANTEKAILDLNTRISAETVLMLNDIAMLQSLTLMAQMEQASLDYNEAGLAMYRPTVGEESTGDLSDPQNWDPQYHPTEKTE